MDRQAQLKQIVRQFGTTRIAVVGDVFADVYLTGMTDRVSREAPIIIVRQESEQLIPGGAANTARNLAALGVQAELTGVVGNDELGRKLKKTLTRAGVGVENVLTCDQYQTIAKTRVLAGAKHTAPQQVLRIDREPQVSPVSRIERALAAAVKRMNKRTDGWMISDYGYRLLTDTLRAWFAKTAEAKPVLADSRYDITGFCGLTAIKPNEQEALHAAGIETNTEQGLIDAAKTLRRRTRARAVVVTLGSKGMLIHRGRGGHRFIPAVGTDQIVDLTGAGDTAGATLIAALTAGADVYQAATLANCAASVVVMKQGCTCCSESDLIDVIEKSIPHE